MQLAGTFERDRPGRAVLQLLALGIDDLAVGVIVDRERLQPGDVVRHRVKDFVGLRLDLLGAGRGPTHPQGKETRADGHPKPRRVAILHCDHHFVSSLLCVKTETPRR